MAHERVLDEAARRFWCSVLDAAGKLQAEIAVPDAYAQWLLDEVAAKLGVESVRL